MKNTVKLVIAAILSLSIGVAVASPLLVTEIIPFHKMPMGPTADFGVDVVYANFKEATGISDRPQVTYQIVFNVTNLADIEAKAVVLDFAAAQNVTMVRGVSGGDLSSSGGGNSGGEFGGVVEGLWLDNEWLNVTWIPGIHPDGLGEVMSSPWGSGDTVRYIANMPTVIPSLPDNASQTGHLTMAYP